MRNIERSVALTDSVNLALCDHLLKGDGEEDLLFALWTPSLGAVRFTSLIHTPIPPLAGDRQRHGNASFNTQYFERVCKLAASQPGCGIAFMHSHLGPGWQGMSDDDVRAELKIAGATAGLTDLPLVGLTVGTDATWSARMWPYAGNKEYGREWCTSVRSVGAQLRVNFMDALRAQPVFRELFKRTVTVWGERNHATMARLRIGIVGLGSVGSLVAEMLARMGLTNFVLIDFDEVQAHNLDRLIGATQADIGVLKVVIAERQIRQSATADRIEVRAVPYSVAEETGYRAALDCDVIFCCVDRPRARSILNHLAYAHLIPVIDGGIDVRFKRGEFSGVDWQLQTVAPGRACLECLGTFLPSDVATEIEGKLDDPSYLRGLPADHRFKRNENVFPFSANLASLEVLQLVALGTGIGGMTDFGVQRYRYLPGTIETDVERTCRTSCEYVELTAQGDRYFQVYGRDLSAEAARERQQCRADSSSTGRLSRWLDRLRFWRTK
ncbi:MAG TPA: ThiF family adenylyltransferase [Pyrinomonadaceae bacterium]|nr:ThiF family adenylyltransferase [Pyrinomonadaceae bacterium]